MLECSDHVPVLTASPNTPPPEHYSTSLTTSRTLVRRHNCYAAVMIISLSCSQKTLSHWQKKKSDRSAAFRDIWVPRSGQALCSWATGAEPRSAAFHSLGLWRSPGTWRLNTSFKSLSRVNILLKSLGLSAVVDDPVIVTKLMELDEVKSETALVTVIDQVKEQGPLVEQGRIFFCGGTGTCQKEMVLWKTLLTLIKINNLCSKHLHEGWQFQLTPQPSAAMYLPQLSPETVWMPIVGAAVVIRAAHCLVSRIRLSRCGMLW